MSRAAGVVLMMLVVVVAGCRAPQLPTMITGSSLTIRGQADAQGQAVTLTGTFERGYYRFTDVDAVTVVLLSGDEASPTQAAVVRLLWAPQAGRTPIDRTATNCTVQYLVFAEPHDPPSDPDVPDAPLSAVGPQVGVYSGAGFLNLRSRPGDATLTASLWDASVQLTDASAAFRDLLGPATMTGQFTATRDDARTQRLLAQLSQRVSERLGYPRLVRAD